MQASELIGLVLLGGLVGLLGQGLRAVVGLKKLRDRSAETGRSFVELFDAGALSTSLLIGFGAGALAVILLAGNDGTIVPEAIPSARENDGATAIVRDHLLVLLAAGYAGADLVEGLMKRHLPRRDASARAHRRAGAEQ